ncbi:MAG TPA: hypothetical protein GX497_00510 [Bacillus bacterium]|nr:hypothetical protein [Bacillus sp. (in: firmicutes)]
MKKLLTFLMGLFVLSSCGNSSYNVELVDTPVFMPDSASKVSFKITEGEKLATGLEVKASFEMEKMDHGSLQVNLKEQGEGVYGGDVHLPMGGDWQALLTITNGKDTKEKMVTFTVEEGKTAATELPADVVATVNGEKISIEDLEFYELINKIQIEMYREADNAKYNGKDLEQAMKYWDAQEASLKNKNTLLTQIIRLRAMALLSEEKGHKASDDEIFAKLNETRNSYRNSPVAQKMIKEYGEEKFWAIQEKQQQAIVLVSKVQQDVINNVKKANPKAELKEVNMLAEKKYEELLVSQVGTLDIKINKL